WQPAVLSSELPERDGPPLRVRLLGEDLIAFRDTNGRVGLLGANCPHRGAPLYFARNEDCGLRCIYHGWKFDAEGRCLETPKAPDRSPQISVLKTDYGLFVGARRDAGGDRNYWRFTQLVLPFYVYVPGAVGSPVHCNVWQPMDDEHTMVWRIQYLNERPFTADERARLLTGTGAHIPPEGYLPPSSEAGGAWTARATRSNDYQQDRGAQRKVSFSGIRGIWAQDRACTEGMGAIMDRTQEHLVASDATLVQ